MYGVGRKRGVWRAYLAKGAVAMVAGCLLFMLHSFYGYEYEGRVFLDTIGCELFGFMGWLWPYNSNT